MEDNILKNSKGATYMSFILDVEIVVKKDRAHFNLAESLIKNKEQGQSQGGDAKTEEEEPKTQESQRESSPSINNEHVEEKEVKTYAMAMEPIHFFDDYKPRREDQLTSVKSISNVVSYIFHQLKSSENGQLKTQDVTKLSQYPDGSHIFIPTGNKKNLIRKFVVEKDEKINSPDSNRIFICNYLKNTNFNDSSKDISLASSTSSLGLSRSDKEDNVLLSVPSMKNRSANSLIVLPSLPVCKTFKWRKSKTRIAPYSTTKSVCGHNLSSGDCKVRKVSSTNKTYKNNNLLHKVNEDSKSSINYESRPNVVKRGFKTSNKTFKMPTVAIEPSVIKKNYTRVKEHLKHHSCEDLHRGHSFKRNDLHERSFLSPKMSLPISLKKKDSIKKFNEDSEQSSTKSHLLKRKELTVSEKKGFDDLEILFFNQTEEIITPNIQITNGTTRLKQFFPSTSVLKIMHHSGKIVIKPESERTWLMTGQDHLNVSPEKSNCSQSLKKLDNHKIPLTNWKDNESDVKAKVQSNNSFQRPPPKRALKRVWEMFRNYFIHEA